MRFGIGLILSLTVSGLSVGCGGVLGTSSKQFSSPGVPTEMKVIAEGDSVVVAPEPLPPPPSEDGPESGDAEEKMPDGDGDGEASSGGGGSSGGIPEVPATPMPSPTAGSEPVPGQGSTEDVPGRPGKPEGKGKPDKAQKGGDDGSDISLCAKALGVEVKKIKFVSTVGDLHIADGEVLALKVTGNQSKLNISFGVDAPGKSVRGLCLFVTGNQSEVTLNVAGKIERLVYKGRGNASSTKVLVSESGEIGSGYANLAGNQASLDVSGKGKLGCSSFATSLKGKAPRFGCKP